jgi:hypothetical protein
MRDSTKSSLLTGPYIVLARSFAVVLGCFAVWWGITGLQLYWRDSSIERIATHIIAGEKYKMETLAQQLPMLDRIEKSAYCRPEALRSAAIIRLRMLEVTASKTDRQKLDDRPKSVGNAIRHSLSCAPADPFLWLALYSVDVNKNGFKPDYLKYLRLSYQLGPHEGWIVQKRSPLAFNSFQKLPSDIREDVLNEFLAMLRDSAFSKQAAEIFVGPAWAERELILAHLNQLNEYERWRFVYLLHEHGYDLLPGIGLAPVDSHRFAPKIRVPQ